jgi:hypothetical protein
VAAAKQTATTRKPDVSGRVRVGHETGFANYYLGILDKFSTIKTLLNSSDKIPVQEIYVGLSFSHRGQPKEGGDIFNAVSSRSSSSKIILSGVGGCGKSMFFKNAVTSMITDRQNPLPIAFELKALNEQSDKLLEAIHKNINLHDKGYSLADLEDDLQNCRFSLLLDGFDEIDYENRPVRHNEIIEIANKFPDLNILITSRPNEGGGNFHAFETFRVEPMTLDQCIELINRIKFDDDIKSAFKERLAAGLYDSHSAYLSNPLLLTMMLLTFSQSGDVPNELVEFYEQTFEALYYKHDRLKGGQYKRSFKSKLQMLEFRNVLSHFCAASYSENKIDFTSTEAFDFLSDSISEYEVDTTPEAVLFDLIESTCLLKQDGLRTTFIHRSFQEYFTAVFVCALDNTFGLKALDTMMTRALSDKVIDMVRALSPTLFEDWAYTKCKRILKIYEKDDMCSDPVRSIRFIYNKVTVSQDSVWSFPYASATTYGQFQNILSTFYSSEFREIWDNNNSTIDDEETLTDFIESDRKRAELLQVFLGEERFKKIRDPNFSYTLPTSKLTREVVDNLGLGHFGPNHYRCIRMVYEDLSAKRAGRVQSFRKMFKKA